MPNAVQYAEDTLGVNAVYERCQLLRTRLEASLEELARIRRDKRENEALLSDFEYELLSQQAAEHSELSQAALERHMKMFLSKDDTHKELRRVIREKQFSIDECEGTMKTLEADIRIESARMTELGGYLQYLAAASYVKLNKSSATS